MYNDSQILSKSSNLDFFVNQPYKYGFTTNIDSEIFPRGLDEKILTLLSNKKNEPNTLLEFRLKSYKKWKKMQKPTWASVNYPKFNFDNIIYYSAPKVKKQLNSIEEVDPKLVETFNKLGISLNEQKRLSNVAIDAIFDSVSIVTTFKKELTSAGVIFCSISEAIKNYPELIQKYLGSVVPIGDNYFSALNSAAFSDGSFCYIPPNTRCPLELSTYFRINNKESGQFERTLIIADENSYVSYLEAVSYTHLTLPTIYSV